MVLSGKILLCFLLAFVLSREVYAQADSSQKSSVKEPEGFFEPSESSKKLSRIERIGYVCGASLAFSLFDYIGSNATKFSHSGRAVYRVVEVAAQIGISYFLYKKCGLSSAISFNLIWWTWGDDVAYYGWAYTLNPKRPWEGRNYNGLQSDGISWAGWTPIGLARKQNSLIDKATLLTQAMLGFSISIAIL